MATIGLSEAARLTGTARSTLYRAIKNGRLSAIIGPGGAVRIDPAELERAFSVRTGRDSIETLRETTRNVVRPTELVARVAELEARLGERDERLREAHATTEDLRRRLDVATAQLGEALQQVRLLTAPPPQPVPRRPWWRWR
jgi:excisionase family DNA binding protein